VKISSDHYATMLKAMRETQAKYPDKNRAHYERNKIGKDHAMRHRWDLLHASNLLPFVCGTLYGYANDTHIDTALRSIVAELEAEAASVPK